MDNIILLIHSLIIAGAGAANDNEVNATPLSTGSVAEFYIEPMLSCVGDVDIMYHFSRELAIPKGHLPPTQLPEEFHGRVRVVEIIDSEFPGYVYLVSYYLLTEISDDVKYHAVPCPRHYGSHGLTREHSREIHGPAVVMKFPLQDLCLSVNSPLNMIPGPFYIRGSMSSLDMVPCIRCLSWPPQTADWPTRHRNYGWSDSATVDGVVSNGCDVVSVAHRLCRQNEWMSNHQWKLSFSRAEITLLNS